MEIRTFAFGLLRATAAVATAVELFEPRMRLSFEPTDLRRRALYRWIALDVRISTDTWFVF